MAINVQYKVPAALLQAERDKERRAFNRQLQLQKNQQNFQREMQDTAYARSLENRQFNADRQDSQQQRLWDRQDALREDERQYRAGLLRDQYRRQDYLREDERQYQQDRLADQRQYAEGQQQKAWDRQDALRREQLDLDIARQQYAEQQRQEQTAEVLRMQEWQKSMVERQKLEQNFSYSSEAQNKLDRIHRSMRDLMSARDTLTPEQFQQAIWDLRAQEAAIMPEVPIVRKTPQEQMQERIATIDIGGVPTQCYIDEKGNIKPLLGSQDDAKTLTAMLELATKGATDKETGIVDKEKMLELYNLYKSFTPQEISKREEAEARARESVASDIARHGGTKYAKEKYEQKRANKVNAVTENTRQEETSGNAPQNGIPTSQNMKHYDSLKNGTPKHNHNFDRR